MTKRDLVFLTQRMLWPLTGLAQGVDLYQRAMASTERILALLATPLASASPGGGPSPPSPASQRSQLPHGPSNSWPK